MAKQQLSLSQKAVQVQTMKLSQQQIMAMNLIAMGNLELREEILKKVDENPALEIKEDKFEGYKSSVHTGKATLAGEEAAEKYQNMLESAPDKTETLQEHLLHQLNMISLPENEHRICKKLIENLDENGYHILAPITLIEKENGDDENLLKKCISIVQHFDPEGICCKDVMESLEIQAKLKKNPPKIALFLLHGRLEMLKPPQAEKVLKKLNKYIEENSKESFWDQVEGDIELKKDDISLEKIQEAIKFIQNLQPFPASEFKVSTEHFVQPDVYVLRDENSGKINISFSNNSIPTLEISKDFKDEENSKNISKENKKSVQNQIKDAESFIETLNFREKSLLTAFKELVKIQKDFFLNGPGHLKPLTQREFAKIINVHESTVSRIAESKFLRCDWGIFPIKYFFTKALSISSEKISEKTSKKNENIAKTSVAQSEISTDSVKLEIENILKAQKQGDKKLSDQKIADLLAQKGIKIARRTVAKYRTQLNIASSYER